MDSRLGRCLRSVEAQIDTLYEAESKYLTLDAAKEHMLANLGVGDSIAAKKVAAYASKEWEAFAKGLALSEADFHKQKHLLDLKNSAFQAEYLQLKIEGDTIKKQQ